MLVVYPDDVWYTYVDRAGHRRDHRPPRRRRRDRREAAHLTPRTTPSASTDRRARRARSRSCINVPDGSAARHRAGRASASAAGRHARQQGRADAGQDVLRAGLRRDALQFPRRRRSRRARSTKAIGETDDALAALAHARSSASAKRCRSRSPGSRSARSCRRASRSASTPERLVLVGPAVNRFAVAARAGRHDRHPRRGGRRRAARRRVRVGAAAGAADRRVPRLRSFLPRPAAAACSA